MVRVHREARQLSCRGLAEARSFVPQTGRRTHSRDTWPSVPGSLRNRQSCHSSDSDIEMKTINNNDNSNKIGPVLILLIIR